MTVTIYNYNPDTLRLFKESNTNIDPNLWSRLRDHDIHRHVVRGNRAGSKKQRSIKVSTTSQHLRSADLPKQSRARPWISSTPRRYTEE